MNKINFIKSSLFIVTSLAISNFCSTIKASEQNNTEHDFVKRNLEYSPAFNHLFTEKIKNKESKKDETIFEFIFKSIKKPLSSHAIISSIDQDVMAKTTTTMIEAFIQSIKRQIELFKILKPQLESIQKHQEQEKIPACPTPTHQSSPILSDSEILTDEPVSPSSPASSTSSDSEKLQIKKEQISHCSTLQIKLAEDAIILSLDYYVWMKLVNNSWNDFVKNSINHPELQNSYNDSFKSTMSSYVGDNYKYLLDRLTSVTDMNFFITNIIPHACIENGIDIDIEEQNIFENPGYLWDNNQLWKENWDKLIQIFNGFSIYNNKEIFTASNDFITKKTRIILLNIVKNNINLIKAKSLINVDGNMLAKALELASIL